MHYKQRVLNRIQNAAVGTEICREEFILDFLKDFERRKSYIALREVMRELVEEGILEGPYTSTWSQRQLWKVVKFPNPWDAIDQLRGEVASLNEALEQRDREILRLEKAIESLQHWTDYPKRK